MDISNSNIIFFDDSCPMCSFWVMFVYKRDLNKSKFVFSAINSELFNRAIPDAIKGNLPDSILVLTPKLDLYYKTEAICFILKELSSIYFLLAFLLNLLPLKFSNFIYDLIARNRKKIFKRDICEIIPDELRRKIIIS